MPGHFGTLHIQSIGVNFQIMQVKKNGKKMRVCSTKHALYGTATVRTGKGW